MTISPLPPGGALHTVLLDVDGTLIDSNDAHARAWVAALAEHGYVIPFDEVRPLIGKGGDKIIPELTSLDPESGEAQRIGESRSRIFLARELPSLQATPGARALLEHLRDLDLELVVATSARATEVNAILSQAGVADLIHAASSADDAERSKPDPDIVRAALSKVRRPAAHSIMLGDTPYDIEAAARARVPAIALRCGGWTDYGLRGAVAVYENPADLLEHFDESPLVVAKGAGKP
jgi:phosphoglycolate phosphatase-like HAD superfamily hydrolase